MDNTDYILKMNNLFFDASVYRKVTKGEGKMKAARSTEMARDSLLRSASGKRLFHLLEEALCNPSMRGLPMVQKPWESPVISTWRISGTSSEVFRVPEKGAVSYDVKSLFTNVTTEGAIRLWLHLPNWKEAE